MEHFRTTVHGTQQSKWVMGKREDDEGWPNPDFKSDTTED